MLILFTLLASLTNTPSTANSDGLAGPQYVEQTPRIEYYSTLVFVESPLAEIRGSRVLTRDVAMSRNHYRFEYDEQGRLSEVGFFAGKNRRERDHTSNLFFLSSSMKFEYTGDTETRSFFDSNGYRTTVLGDVARWVYGLDSLGRKTSLVFENSEGVQIENEWGIARYEWTYNSDGSVIESRFNQGGVPQAIRPGFEFYRVRLSYDYRGYIALMQNIDEHGRLVENPSGAAQDRMEVNEYGNLIAWNVLDKTGNLQRGNGPNVARGVQTFNEWGYETSIRFEDESGQAIQTAYGFYNSRTTFDRWGNIESRTFYDSSGKPTAHAQAGYVSLKMEWDRSGRNRVKLSYFDAEGVPVLHASRGYSVTRNAHDASGRLISVTFEDATGKLVDRLDTRVARIEYSYTEDGQREARRYSASGVLVQDAATQ